MQKKGYEKVSKEEFAVTWKEWRETCLKNSITYKVFYRRVLEYGWEITRAATQPTRRSKNVQYCEYALYKGDELLGIGTITELSEKCGVMIESLRHYATPTYRRKACKDGSKRRVLVKIDD